MPKNKEEPGRENHKMTGREGRWGSGQGHSFQRPAEVPQDNEEFNAHSLKEAGDITTWGTPPGRKMK